MGMVALRGVCVNGRAGEDPSSIKITMKQREFCLHLLQQLTPDLFNVCYNARIFYLIEHYQHSSHKLNKEQTGC